MATTSPSRTAGAVTIGVWGTIALGLLSTLGPLSTDLHLPGLPEIARSLDTSDAAVAATISVCIAGFALGQLVIGGISDRFGRRGPTITCIGLFAVTGALCALAPTIEVLLAVRFFQGFFGAGSVVTTRAAVRDHAKGAAAAKLYSQLAMVAMVAPVLAPVLGGQVLRFTSWRGLFWVFTGISVALLLLAVVAMKESLPPERRRRAGTGQWRTMWRVLRHPGFAPYLVLAVCQGIVLFSYLTMSSVFLQTEYDVSAQGYSMIVGTVGAGMMLAHSVNVRFAPRWGALNTLTGSVVCYFSGCVLLTTTVLLDAPLWLVVVAMVLTLPSLSPSMPNNMALALVPFGAAAGAASALLGSAQQIAGAVVPSIAVHVGSSGTVMAVTMLIGATIALLQLFGTVRPALRMGPHPDFDVDLAGPTVRALEG